MMSETDKLATGVQGGFSVVAMTFLQESVVAMIPWLFVMFAVIFCDLCFALRRCVLTGESIRISRAVRRTMGKCVTYFSFVLMVTMIEVAEGGSLHIDRWACLLICAVEFSSILSNILQPKGYDVDFVKAFTVVVRKWFGVEVDKLDKNE
ncbi:MAG: phage holin family protein [Bacteroidales bacterium]|nr:phage holin family protein [Bacteroidales bacterium]